MSGRLIPEWPPDQFRFGNYGADIPSDVYIAGGKKFVKWLMAQNVVGYQLNPEFKTRAGEFAVMFEMENGGEYWSHVPIEVFNQYWDELEKIS